MIKDIKPYTGYKDSRQAWLGEIPAHWPVLPNRAIFIEVKERNHPDAEMLSVTITQGVIRQKKLLSGSSKKDSSNLDKSAYKLVSPGDIAYNKMRAWQGALGVSDLRGIISPAYVVMRPREPQNTRYFHYLFRTPHFAKEAERWSYGITSDMWSLRPEHFKIIYSPLPPADEQAAIVRFLDHANRRLDKAIRVKRKLIALLNEQKQAIIHRAVTRGLEPNVPLKDSGIPWLGEIPAHWEIISFGVASELIQTGPFGSQLHSHEYINGGIPVINPAHMRDDKIVANSMISVSLSKASALVRHKLQLGDIIAARRGELGRCAVVTEHEKGWLCGTGSLLIRLRRDFFNPYYFQRIFSSQGIRDSLSLASVGATMENLNAGIVARLRLPFPPLKEQEGIVKVFTSESEREGKITARIEREISLLREYKTRLTTDVVTGKLDVREAARLLPDDSAEPDEARVVADDEDTLEDLSLEGVDDMETEA